MRVSREMMAENHQRIVLEASRLLRKHGIEGTTVGDVMLAAGLTHGGFYRHFESKDAMVAESATAAFEGLAAGIDARIDDKGLKEAIDAYVDVYLSPGHLQHPEGGCPMASLGIEAGRGPADVRTAFAVGAEKILERMAKASGSANADSRAAALRQLALMVGGVVMARAVAGSDLQDEILMACRDVRLDKLT